jgi:RNA recognition motif-containing protein
MNIYVGNLDFKTTEDELKKAFEQYGQVESVKIITDKYSGDSKGFAFVEMPSEQEGKAALDALDGYMLGSRNIKVNEARPREDRPSGGPRGGGNRGGAGGGGNRGKRW